MSTKRLFWAVNLPAALKADIYQQLQVLRQINAPVKWVEPHNLHVTLKFLGNVAEQDIKAIVAAAEKNITDLTSFGLNLAGLGFFPSRKRPRVIWVGITGAVSQMEMLFKGIEDSMVDLGFARQQHDFRPHLTLGRLRSSQGAPDLVQAAGQVDVKAINFGFAQVTTVELMESQLTPKGPVYTVLATLNLR